MKRYQILIKGAVQGVGFRPFIYRLAGELNVRGFISNTAKGVSIEAECEETVLNYFLQKIRTDKPRYSVINSLEYSELDLNGYKDFKIIGSETGGDPAAVILPDIAVCDECLAEMSDPANRRFLYPFINCTNCGPRFSIVEALPYDRPNTSMKVFKMCEDCKREYNDPYNRRFHAQPIACPKCGPHIELLDHNGEKICEKDSIIRITAEKIKQGNIIALKGLGGFQLIVYVRKDFPVRRLRERKHRDEKPFALMFPDMDSIREVCIVSGPEESLLLSPESPVVLLERKKNSGNTVSEFAAPQNPYLGVMLPYTPLHHLLMKELNEPVVATSGNISEEPMCIDEEEALVRLNGIADYFLIHNRPVVRPVDDSVARVVKGKPVILRRARGYAPLPVSVRNSCKKNFISTGGNLKNTVSVKKDSEIYISQHIGDLANMEAEKGFLNTISDFMQMYNVNSDFLVHDQHPDYLSTKYCLSQKSEKITVQHHLAHIAACYEENKLEGECLAVCWDGTGYGSDKTIWGGEFFIYDREQYRHAAQFRQFRLPGGESAVKESVRSLAGILFEIFGKEIPYEKFFKDRTCSPDDFRLFIQMLDKNINCFTTSSAGRIFDAVSSLLNICHKSSYEGQAAMMLEFTAARNINSFYNFNLLEKEKLTADWQPVFEEMFDDLDNKVASPVISAKFHNTLAEIILRLAQTFKYRNIVLTGGCFQNIFLLERTIDKLTEKGFIPFWHHQIPTNDGGISFGQAVFANNIINKLKKQYRV